MSGSTRPMLSEDVVHRFRVERFGRAIAAVCARSGFGAVSVTDVVTEAGTSRNTFYTTFGNRQECFLGALELAEEEAFGRVRAACEAAGGGRDERLEAGLAALLDWVADEPALAHVLIVEALCAGPASLDLHLRVIERFAEELREVVPTEVERPPTFDESVVGGIAAILSSILRTGRAASAPRLLPQLLGFVRAPYRSV